MKIKSIIKDLCPPLFLRSLTGMFYGWKGNYTSWASASAQASGYDSEIILNRVKNALLKVKNGEAVYERDSVIFDKVSYSFPLLSALSQVALKNNRKLNVLDFGGSLGSSYNQNKSFFSDLDQFNWCIVEQKHFVEEGKKTFADKNLHFFYTIEECMNNYNIDVLLLSGVIQYLENPYQFLESIINSNVEYIFIDRIPLTNKNKDLLTLQTVPKKIYNAKYPCWILNEKSLLDYISKHYELIYEHETEETINISHSNFKAFFFKKK
ncbi:MAG: methyltransferase, TIGR04325 family [Bacteroidia bacterium]